MAEALGFLVLIPMITILVLVAVIMALEYLFDVIRDFFQ
jgi:hypothetical protein